MFGGRSKRADLERSSVFDLGMKPIRRHLMMLVSWTCHSRVALRVLLYLCFLMLILAFDFVLVFLTSMRLMRMLMDRWRWASILKSVWAMSHKLSALRSAIATVAWKTASSVILAAFPLRVLKSLVFHSMSTSSSCFLSAATLSTLACFSKIDFMRGKADDELIDPPLDLIDIGGEGGRSTWAERRRTFGTAAADRTDLFGEEVAWQTCSFGICVAVCLN